MEVLQSITAMLNKEDNCPASINKCELLYDAENVRVLLMLRLDGISAADKAYIDICCCGNDGTRLAVMEKIPYSDGGMFIELPSLMTASAEIILRSVESDGNAWSSDAEFPQAVVSDDTMEFDSSSVAEAAERSEKRPRLTRAERRAQRREKAAEEEELRQFIKNDPHEKRMRIIGRILTILILAGLCTGGVYAYKYKTEADAIYKRGMNLYYSGRFEEALSELENAEKYVFFGEEKKELDWCLAMSYSRQRDFFPASVYYKNLSGYKESRSNYRSIIQAYTGIIAAGGSHTAALTSDGSVTAVGNNEKKQCETSNWTDIIRIAAGGDHTLGITRDNTVVSTGDNSRKQCNTDKWKNIIAVACGSSHSVGVENIGRVVATGDNTYGQCEVDDWSGIVAVSAGSEHTVGLKIDGTVVACGNNSSGACDVGEWTDIALIAAGNGFTAGLKYDGSIVFTGNDTSGISAVTTADNALSISAGANHILVLGEDGRVASYGGNDSNQGTTSLWAKAVAVAAGERHSVAVTADGTLLGAGCDSDKQISLSSISAVGIPKSTVTIRKGDEQ